MAKISEKEYEYLKSLDDKWKWIARDGVNNRLYAYLGKPNKHTKYWKDEELMFEQIDENLFQFIQWKDEKPYNIQDLIDEYESSLIKATPWTPYPLDFESEETEVKDLKWFRKEILDNKFRGHTIHIDVLFELMDQLDEPEVLSWEWIDENKEYNDVHDIGYYIPVEKLQNLLVPKQPFGNSEELPVIPQFVAEWIEAERGTMSNWKLPSRFISDAKYKKDQRRYKWSQVEGNMDKFMSALINGYEVEEEQKYVVELPNPNNQMGRHKNVFLNKKDGKVFIDSASLFGDDITKYGQLALTEEEIKKDFEWAWEFAVPVEEVEG